MRDHAQTVDYDRGRLDSMSQDVARHDVILGQHTEDLKGKVSMESFKPIQSFYYAVVGTLAFAMVSLALKFLPRLFGYH